MKRPSFVRAMQRGIGLLAAVTAVCLGLGCAVLPPRLIEGPVRVSLVELLADPKAIPSGQTVLVRGHLGRGFDPILYLTAEHAAVFDLTSSIRVVDPTEDGRLSRSECFDRFVSVTGTLTHEPSGETTIRSPTRIEYMNEKPPRSVADWRNLFVVCWPEGAP